MYEDYTREYGNDVDKQVTYFPGIVTAMLVRLGSWYQHKQNLISGKSNWLWTPDLSNLSFNFYLRSATLRVYFTYNDSNFGQEIGDYMLLGQKENCDLKAIQLKFAEFVKFLVPQSKFANMITECESPFHKKHAICSCELTEGHWWCRDCQNIINYDTQEHFNLLLVSGIESLKSERDKERAKITPKLRFTVLERDKFTCKACGRNPREDSVKLHVDHIVAIAKGGKSEMDNLQTLCQDCNLAKHDKRVKQMELWPLTA